MEERVRDKNCLPELWTRFRTGDQLAFGEIYEQVVDSLFDYGRKITADRELVKDCIHDMFINLYRYSPDLKKPDSFMFFLIRSLRNLIIQKITKADKFILFPPGEFSSSQFRFLIEDHPSENDSKNQYVRAMLAIIDDLDTKKREILYLKFYAGLNYAEIGEILEMKTDAVKKQVYRTLDNLRGKFKSHIIELFLLLIKQ